MDFADLEKGVYYMEKSKISLKKYQKFSKFNFTLYFSNILFYNIDTLTKGGNLYETSI